MRTHRSRGHRSARGGLRFAAAAAAVVGTLLGSALPAAATTPTNVRVTTGLGLKDYGKSSSMAKSPANDTNMAIAYAKDGDTDSTGLLACFVAISSDGGGTWTDVAVVGTMGNPLPTPPSGVPTGAHTRCQSPGVAYNAAGTSLVYVFQEAIYVNGLGGRFDFGFTYATKSTDGGSTWGTPVLVSDPGYVSGTYDLGGDWYPSVSVDTVPNSGALNSIYVTWVRYKQSFNNKDVFLAKASFSSFTFATAVQVNPTVTGSNNGTVANEGGGGAPSVVNEADEVCVTWEDLTATFNDSGTTAPTAKVTCATAAGGTTFNTPTNLGNVVPTGTPSCPSFSTTFHCGTIQSSFSIASGPCPTGTTCTNGQVQVAYTDTVNGKISLASSTSGGSTYSTAITVALAVSGHQDFSPWLSINRGDGRLDLSYYDLDTGTACSVPSGATAGKRHTYHVQSATAGANLGTKASAIVTDTCSDQNIVPGAQSLGFFPAHEGRVVSASTNTSGTGTVVGWTDTRNSGVEGGTHQRWDVYSQKCTTAAGCLT